MDWVYKRGNTVINLKRFIPFVALVLVFIGNIVYFTVSGNEKVVPAVSTNVTKKSEASSKVTLTFIGDLLMHTAERKSGFIESENRYDFNYFFKDVKKYFEGKDFVVGSFETPVSKESSDKGYFGYPTFNNPPEFIEAIKNAGVNVFATANNHALDRGEKGAHTTMEWIEQYKVPYTGTFKTSEDKKNNPVLFLEKNNIKVGLINYAEFSNMGVPKSPYILNLIDLENIKKDIAFAKANKADTVVVWLHFGNEYQRQPSEKQKQLVDEVAKAGADIIIGSHPHVLQPMEVKNVDGRKVFVAYSLGNFISNQYWRHSTDGLILNIDLEKKNGRTEFKNANYIPTAVIREYKGPQTKNELAVKPNDKASDFITGAISRGLIKGNEVKFRVVPVGQAIYDYENKQDENLEDKDHVRLKTSWDDITGLIGEAEGYKVYRDDKTMSFPLGQKASEQPMVPEPAKKPVEQSAKPKTEVKTTKSSTGKTTISKAATTQKSTTQPKSTTTTSTANKTNAAKEPVKTAPKVGEIKVLD